MATIWYGCSSWLLFGMSVHHGYYLVCLLCRNGFEFGSNTIFSFSLRIIFNFYCSKTKRSIVLKSKIQALFFYKHVAYKLTKCILRRSTLSASFFEHEIIKPEYLYSLVICKFFRFIYLVLLSIDPYLLKVMIYVFFTSVSNSDNIFPVCKDFSSGLPLR